MLTKREVVIEPRYYPAYVGLGGFLLRALRKLKGKRGPWVSLEIHFPKTIPEPIQTVEPVSHRSMISTPPSAEESTSK